MDHDVRLAARVERQETHGVLGVVDEMMSHAHRVEKPLPLPAPDHAIQLVCARSAGRRVRAAAPPRRGGSDRGRRLRRVVAPTGSIPAARTRPGGSAERAGSEIPAARAAHQRQDRERLARSEAYALCRAEAVRRAARVPITAPPECQSEGWTMVPMLDGSVRRLQPARW